MVALADWLQRIFPTNLFFNWEHFPVSMEYDGFSCPSYCLPLANHCLLQERNGERDMSPSAIGWPLLHFTSTWPNYTLRYHVVILRQMFPSSLVRLGEPWVMRRVYKASAYLHRPSFWLSDWTWVWSRLHTTLDVSEFLSWLFCGFTRENLAFDWLLSF